MRPGVIVDSGPSLDPADGSDQHVECRHASERQENEEKQESVRGPPDGKLGDIHAKVATQERFGDAE